MQLDYYSLLVHVFQPFVEHHCWWTIRPLEIHEAKFLQLTLCIFLTELCMLSLTLLEIILLMLCATLFGFFRFQVLITSRRRGFGRFWPRSCRAHRTAGRPTLWSASHPVSPSSSRPNPRTPSTKNSSNTRWKPSTKSGKVRAEGLTIIVEDTSHCLFIYCKKYLAGLQSKSGLWIDVVCLSSHLFDVNNLVYLCI